MIAQGLYFSEAKDLGKLPMASLSLMAPNAGGLGENQ